MIQAGIIGGTGYTAGELLRILVHHPNVNIGFIYSHSCAGEPISSVHEDLFMFPDLVFTDQIDADADVIFLCLGHGLSSDFLAKNTFAEKTRIIDLSNDFRLKKDAVFQEQSFVYGLPELNKEQIKQAKYIANPGCFATAIQLGLLPLAATGLLQNDVHIQGITGSTGAGKSLSETSHFTWRESNLSIYKAFSHQHLDEISESLQSLQEDWQNQLHFVPVRGDFTRGIFVSMYTQTDLDESELLELYSSYYGNESFVGITNQTIHLKQVVNTNYCLIQITKKNNQVLITSVIDNLLKGASGQAVQNMNLLFGLEENTGLQLKANYY